MSHSSKLNSNNFTEIKPADVDKLMLIELACHSHPWSEKTFLSCIGGRYFGENLGEKMGESPSTNLPAATEHKASNVIGFYIGEYVIGEATLMDICVMPSEQGKGYGKVLLKQFLAQAKKLGATKIFLEVRAKNIAAQMLYMNAGFIEINRRTGYYPSSSGFGYEDAIVMSLTC
ncbi:MULTISPECIES: ribosomal protein S18-alanine N-acetyltransferase [Colwellia]|uniref:[Ribosomal protein bS18]-alanine N-acetyltransferase n=1 Tax=Colwellia marinimaniae TaxID=1513592 RepID=A0ABQ0MR50_9GAMM|nr:MULTISPECIES: ribosomal protein S18-alanine N-acetyltransferase [Colwellia]GAW94848.1 ribosomal-protein-alanine acetyltransferase [Colwellia marinimaniae]